MLCDVLHDAEAPIVFTGAIRPASAPGADGPANTVDAVSVAASEAAAGMGVLVCFGGEIHHARGVRKTDTTSLVAFSSPQTGPLGRVSEGHPTIWSRIPRNPPLDPPHLDRRVVLVPTAAGDDGALARAALATEPDGAVIGTLGAGHLNPELLELWQDAAERIPVIAYCRSERGVILNATYGYRGSEQDLRARRDHPGRLPLPAGGADEAARVPRLRPLDRRDPLGVPPGRRLSKPAVVSAPRRAARGGSRRPRCERVWAVVMIHHLNCGTLCPFGGSLVSGEGGLRGAHIVCHCLLIEHGDSLVLVDTGMGAGDVAHPYRSLGVPFTAAFRPQADPGETAVQRVRALGLDPADVRHIACTHLDLDHAGGLPDFPDAEVHVFAAEKDAAVDPSLRDRARYPSCHIDHGPKWAIHDVDGDTWHGFESVRLLPGDGPEILLIPLVGHSRGHTGDGRPRRRRLAAALRRRLLPSRPDGDPAPLPARAAPVPDRDGRRRLGARQQRAAAERARPRPRRRGAPVLRPRPGRARARHRRARARDAG